MTDLGTSSEYERARARAQKKRKFRGDLMAYVVVNAFLVGVWAVTGLGYFWPGWVMGAWGVFMILSAWDLFYRQELSEEEIQREMHRNRT
ncbi:MAG TPA: 2TM domain-containing protein [Streptosporangiaceae bacterium]|nr:2TM domain-containing protein [Streptosporangiaceae bacterium]